jgi:hypothetical protein
MKDQLRIMLFSYLLFLIHRQDQNVYLKIRKRSLQIQAHNNSQELKRIQIVSLLFP